MPVAPVSGSAASDNYRKKCAAAGSQAAAYKYLPERLYAATLLPLLLLALSFVPLAGRVLSFAQLRKRAISSDMVVAKGTVRRTAASSSA